MSMDTNLIGRLRNTPLPRSHGMFPLFEAVVNSIHSIDELTAERDFGKITVEIIRAPFQALPFDGGKSKRGVQPSEEIVGFKIIDNGVGFHDRNMKSFATLDTDYKESLRMPGCGASAMAESLPVGYCN